MDNLLKEKDYEQIDILNKLLKNDPKNLDLLMQKAFIYWQGYDTKNVITNYEYILSLYPKYIDAYFWLAYYFYQINGATDDAIKIAKKGLIIDPNCAKLHAVLAWSIGYDGNNEKDFLFHINKAIEIEPSWISTRISSIEYLLEKQDFDQARKEIHEALSKIQDDFPIPIDKIEYEFEAGFTRRYDNTARGILKNWLKDIKGKL